VSNALRTTRLGVFAALAVSALALAGCTAGSPTGDPAVADQVVVALPGDIDNFDPHTNQLNIYQFAVRDLVFSTLVKYDVALEIQPDLADFEVNDDATVFTFSIDPDAVFQDETPVNADAVIQSLERAAGTEGSIWAPRLADVASYDATDDTTVTITLNSPNAAFLAGLTDIAIIAPSNFDDVASAPVGSGPYSFTSWEPNKQIELTRFDDYFGEAAPTKTIIEQPIADQQVALNNLYSGTVDVMTTASAATVAQVDASRATVVEPDTSNSLQLIEYNSSGKLADPRVRQALAYALDKDSIQEIAFGGGGSTAWSPIPESSWAYAEQDGYPYDLDKAKALLAEAGVSDLTFDLEILTGYPEAESIARVWQASLAEIGVTLNPKVEELSVWLDKYIARDYDATWNAFNVGGDPNSFFDVIMTPHLGDDYPNTEVTDLVAQAKSVSDQDARAAIYAQLQEIIVADLPVMIVQSSPVAAIVGTKVTGYEINPLGNSLLAQVAVTK